MICSSAIARAADQSEDAIGVLDVTESQLLEVSEKGLTHGLEGIDKIVANSFGSIDNLYKQSREVTGLATDFTDLDRLTSGLQKDELIIIAARPSMGKTALAINIAQNAAINHNSIVAVFSLEMSKESLLRRMLASQAWVDQQLLQKGFLGQEEHGKLQKALGELVESHIFIDDSAASTIAEMRAKARRLKQNNGGLDLIMIDYLQLMSATMPGASKRGFENRVQEVSACLLYTSTFADDRIRVTVEREGEIVERVPVFDPAGVVSTAQMKAGPAPARRSGQTPVPCANPEAGCATAEGPVPGKTLSVVELRATSKLEYEIRPVS